MGFDTAFTLLQDVFSFTAFSGSYLVFQFIIILATLALITRKMSDWGVLALPVSVGWHSSFLSISPLIITATTIIFVVSALSSVEMVNFISATGRKVGEYTQSSMSASGRAKIRTRRQLSNEKARIDLLEKQGQLALKKGNQTKAFKIARKLDLEKQMIAYTKRQAKLLGYETRDKDEKKTDKMIENLRKLKEEGRKQDLQTLGIKNKVIAKNQMEMLDAGIMKTLVTNEAFKQGVNPLKTSGKRLPLFRDEVNQKLNLENQAGYLSYAPGELKKLLEKKKKRDKK